MASLADRARGVEEALEGATRYLDLALALTRAKTGETILYAGGRWDRLDRHFVAGDPESVAVVEMEESQVGWVEWFARFLADYREGRPRDVSLALVAGDRRGGKTFSTYLCQVAALIDVPSLPDGRATIGWTISRTYRQRDELDQLMLSRLPAAYYRWQRAPEHRFTLAHGSYLRNMSADDPDALKQGRVDFLLYNDAQMVGATAVKNGLYGTADAGGLCVLAANPPSGPGGDWLRDLKDAVEQDEEIARVSRFFGFSSKQNTKIDSAARARVGAIARRLDPAMAEADEEGAWKRWGDLAYPSWNGRPVEHGGLVGDPPPDAQDETPAATRREFGAPYWHVIGGDFQRRPQAAAVLRILRVEDVAGPVYWFVDEVGVRGTEVELSTEMMGAPHSYSPEVASPRSAAWVGDCSGSWQGAQRIPGRTSFGLLEAEGWRVLPAEVVRVVGHSDHPKNPDVAQRLGLVQRLMEARRLRVAPACEWLREALAKCQMRKTDTGRRIPVGRFAHITDAAAYAVWRFEPRPSAARPPRPGDLRTIARPGRRGFL